MHMRKVWLDAEGLSILAHGAGWIAWREIIEEYLVFSVLYLHMFSVQFLRNMSSCCLFFGYNVRVLVKNKADVITVKR